ncbi:hypothetical protein CR159_14640 [Pollutimonas subterranea]|uniref:Uncharacterized protein n=1 Tax=Pollutimonas subterranea TaxID=2045210 RepID=A0A2N4U2K0_9BURK|nr:hypothetical protein CR159_14640 [Pollutimonas subterranea]
MSRPAAFHLGRNWLALAGIVRIWGVCARQVGILWVGQRLPWLWWHADVRILRVVWAMIGERLHGILLCGACRPRAEVTIKYYLMVIQQGAYLQEGAYEEAAAATWPGRRWWLGPHE